MRLSLCLLGLLASMSVVADTIGSAVVGKVGDVKELEQLTVCAKRGETYFDGNGSGCFVSSNGRVLTNCHVVDGAAEIVAVYDGIAYKMKVVKKNKEMDLALLEFDGLAYAIGCEIDFSSFKTPSFPCVTGRMHCVNVGERITVVGYPHVTLQGLEAKVTRGIVSSRTGFKGDKSNFQMDAAISGGNSGGPVFDASGSLVGISVSRFVYGENANYAINLDVIQKFLGDSLKLNMLSSTEKGGNSEDVGDMVESAVLILSYKTGARPHDIETKSVRDGNEARAKTEKACLYAKLLKLRMEWKELKALTDGLIRSGCADDDIVAMNNQSREELGLQLIVYAEVDGADVKARIKPICGIRDLFVQCEEAFALDGASVKRGFPVKAELSYHTPQGALWKGSLDEIYDWRGTKEIRIKLNKVIVK